MDKKPLVLDLDRTLVYATPKPSEKYHFCVGPFEIPLLWYVQKRPGVDNLLLKLAKNYEIIVFTAATKGYANATLDKLDVNNVISFRLYKDSCTVIQGVLVKDLTKLGRDLKNVIIVDDNPSSYKLQPENAFPVKEFKGDMSDNELSKVVDFCEEAAKSDDMRKSIRMHHLEKHCESSNRSATGKLGTS